MASRKAQVILILVTFCCVVLLDQVSKAVVMANIPEGGETYGEHRGEFFWFTHQRNPGLVGGMFSGKKVVTFLAPLLATGVLLYLFRLLDRASKFQALAYGLVAGGALGNLIDRFIYGSVTDFLQFPFHFIPFGFPWKLYPAFNVADSCICVGVFLLILTWRQMDEGKDQEGKGDKENAPDPA